MAWLTPTLQAEQVQNLLSSRLWFYIFFVRPIYGARCNLDGKRFFIMGRMKLPNYTQIPNYFIENMHKPVIAAINGFALGGGLELAMAAHFRVASHNAKMGLPETSLGLIPGYGGTQRLPQLVGKGRAMEMIMTAGMIPAEKALEYGLVNHVTSVEELLPMAKNIANKICNNLFFKKFINFSYLSVLGCFNLKVFK